VHTHRYPVHVVPEDTRREETESLMLSLDPDGDGKVVHIRKQIDGIYPDRWLTFNILIVQISRQMAYF
jgi:hypothetical protein